MTRPVIYQIFTRLFANEKRDPVFSGTIEENGSGKFNGITKTALEEIKKLGITHIWYTGIISHATSTSYKNLESDPPEILKGRAGSPYAIRDYYDIDPDLAENVDNRMGEFENLIERNHKLDLKVIIDFVPNHVARNYNSKKRDNSSFYLGENDNKSLSFSPKNNFYYLQDKEFSPPNGVEPFGKNQKWKKANYTENPAKVTGNNCFNENPSIFDWYETVKINYGVDFQNGEKKYFDPIPDSWKKMRDILLFWASKGVDGFRCDMAEMVPVEFWQWAISEVKKSFPEIIFIAEIYQEEKYKNYVEQGGFDYLYDKVGLYDTLRNIIEKKESASAITNCWQALNGLDAKMLTFLENHDEQRIASKFFANNPEKALPGMIVSSLINRGSVMIYAGQEVGENGDGATGFGGDDGRTTIFDYSSLPELQKWTNHGNFDGKLLSEKQLQLRENYKKILSLTNNYSAFREGAFYDLMWSNNNSEKFDEKSLYTFLRYDKKTLFLVVVNFSNKDRRTSIKIPEHAYETVLKKKQENFEGINIWNNEKYFWKREDSIREGISVLVPSYGSSIVKVSLLNPV